MVESRANSDGGLDSSEGLTTAWTHLRREEIIAAVADRDSRKCGDRDQLSRSPDASRCYPGHRARHPADEPAIFLSSVRVPDFLRLHVCGRREIDGRSWHTTRLHLDYGVLVARLCEPRICCGILHARREPFPARHGRRRRISCCDPRRGGMVSREGTRHFDGHHQWRHRRWRRCCAAIDRLNFGIYELAMDFLHNRSYRPALDCVVAAYIFSSTRPLETEQPRARENSARDGDSILGPQNSLGAALAHSRSVGTRDCKVPQRWGMVFLPFLAAEISLRCARLRYQGSRQAHNSLRGNGRRLPSRRIILKLSGASRFFA